MKTRSAAICVSLTIASALGTFIFGASPSAAQVNCSRVLNERCSQTYRVDAGNATHTSQGEKRKDNEVTVPPGYVVVNFREINESSKSGGGTFNVNYTARGTISQVVRQYASESSRISDYKAKVDALYQSDPASEKKAKLDILRNQLNALRSASNTASSVNTNTDVFTLSATSQYQCTRMVFGECVDGRGGHGKGSLIVDLVFVGDNPSATLNSIRQQLTQLSSPQTPSTAYFNYRGAVRWYRRSAGGYCGITSPTHLKVLQITDPAQSLGDRSPSQFGRDLGVCPPYAFYFNYGGGVLHFSSNRGGYCAFTTPQHLQRFQQSNPAISLGNQTPQRDFGRNTGVCP